MPKFPKLSSIPKPPMPAWLKNRENQAKGYSYVNIVIQVYQLYSYWFDIYDFGHHFLYGLIFCGFVILPMVLAFFLLISLHKRQLQRVGIWWASEIGLLVLNINLFVVGIYGISWKTVINLSLHSALRVYGLKIIYSYMVSVEQQYEEGTSLNRVSASKGKETMVDVPLDDPWSGEEKL